MRETDLIRKGIERRGGKGNSEEYCYITGVRKVSLWKETKSQSRESSELGRGSSGDSSEINCLHDPEQATCHLHVKINTLD